MTGLVEQRLSKKLRIAFVLPAAGLLPIGGFKVVYEYANHLARRGHQVTVVHPARLDQSHGAWEFARSVARYVYRKATGRYKPDRWFNLDPAVRLTWVRDLSERNIPDGDAIVATAWQTAEHVAAYRAVKGRPYYLIQHLETWSGEDERVYATWRLPLRKIVIAKWLQQVANQLGEHAAYIPNGLDFSRFALDVAPEQRDLFNVMMLFHDLEWKGSQDGMDALSIAKQQVPSLNCTLFGVPTAPASLPSWIRYYRLPDQTTLRKLYNSAAIFIAPSWTEGWGLPATEAMMCGAALAATDIGGHREFSIHEQTALLSPVKDPKALAKSIVRLIQDNSLRIRLSTQGHSFVQQFTWDRAADSFERLLLNSGAFVEEAV